MKICYQLIYNLQSLWGINKFICPSRPERMYLPVVVLDSSTRAADVPTAMIFLRLSIVSFTIDAVESGMMKNSQSMRCFVRSSTSTGRNVPRPICSVTGATRTPFFSILLMRSFVKCKPEVGAATEPIVFA